MSDNNHDEAPSVQYEDERGLDEAYDGTNTLWDEYLCSPLVGGDLFEGIDVGDNEPRAQLSPPRRQVVLNIQNTRVLFPQAPYKSQLDMMKALISSLNRKANSLIESPTGSGKTLALLCAVLAWRKDKFKRDGKTPPKIYYCTKTHTQVSTVIKELRKTSYIRPDAVPPLKISVLGSRSKMCVNDAVVNDPRTSVDDLCVKMKRNFMQGRPGTCPFFQKPEDDYFLNTGNRMDGLLDIEDLQNIGRNKGCCPYFGTKRQLPTADFVICPYNYVISAHIRRTQKISLKNAIVIFDEGHNLEKTLCTEGSMSFEDKLFRDIFFKCRTLSRNVTASPEVKGASDRLFKVFHGISEWMKQYKVSSHSPRDLEKIAGRVILEKLKEEGGLENLDQVEADLRVVTDPRAAGTGPVLDRTTSQNIQKVVTVLEYVSKTDSANYFIFLGKVRDDVRLNVMCTNPGIVFQEISRETRSIAITSGTLTPLDTYAKELRVQFMEPLSLQQSIPRERYFAPILSVGPEGSIPGLTMHQRTNAASHLGEAIIQICSKVPNGVIVFFPSKEFLRIMMEEWKYSLTPEGTLLERLNAIKKVFSEGDMHSQQNTRDLLEKYRNQSKDNDGAVLFGVHRGKVSEGVDFRDHEARAVINIGIPYAPLQSPDVKARKMLYKNDERFWTWYATDAFRAVNQGLGRSLRHRNDWGAVIMIDPRFHREDLKKLLPKWILDAVQEYSSPSGFDEMMTGLSTFVNRMKNEV